jgi:hypothetical protein
VGGKTIPRDVVVVAASKDEAKTEDKKAWAGKGGGGKKKGKEVKLTQKEMTMIAVEKTKVSSPIFITLVITRSLLPSIACRLSVPPFPFLTACIIDVSYFLSCPS